MKLRLLTLALGLVLVGSSMQADNNATLMSAKSTASGSGNAVQSQQQSAAPAANSGSNRGMLPPSPIKDVDSEVNIHAGAVRSHN